ncbi:hypothetical protein [Pseudonocardia sp. T1-2H]|uniref:hypothetical protein n=1 Tax=Pseudonocardia sp. T1-2H TaxID=3128899 RepID=UPI003100D567
MTIAATATEQDLAAAATARFRERVLGAGTYQIDFAVKEPRWPWLRTSDVVEAASPVAAYGQFLVRHGEAISAGTLRVLAVWAVVDGGTEPCSSSFGFTV